MGKSDALLTSSSYLFLLLFGRISGFFLFSPFFSGRLNVTIRLALSSVLAFISIPLLGEQTISSSHPINFILLLAKEILVGYLLGFLFSLLFEAAAFAGELITTAGGFSAVEIFTNGSSFEQPLFTQFFSLSVLILFFALDLHHFLIRLLFESYTLFPIGTFLLNEETFLNILHSFQNMFHYALAYAWFPLTLLLCINILFALFSRELMIFLNGLPLQIFVTFLVVALSFSNFDKILLENFNDLIKVIKIGLRVT